MAFISQAFFFYFMAVFPYIDLMILVKRRALIFPDFHTTIAKLFYELDTFDSDLCDPFLGSCIYISWLYVSLFLILIFLLKENWRGLQY